MVQSNVARAQSVSKSLINLKIFASAAYDSCQSRMPYTHHSHSGQFCHHASGKLEEVVNSAIEKGFHTIGLTEHMPRFSESELYPEEIEVRSMLIVHCNHADP
jgi:hypothetical protein